MRAAWLTPEVVQGHDVRVLEPGHHPRFALEPANIRRVVRQIRAHDLDGHLPSNRRLDGSIDRPECPLAQCVHQDVAARRSSRGDGVQGRIGDGDPLIELDEFAGRLETGLVGEVVAIGLERPERLHLAAGAMQSEHQLAPKPVPQRMLGDEAFELSCRIAVPAEIEQRLAALLLGREPEFLETRGRRAAPAFIRELGERAPTPAGDAHAERLERIERLGLAGRQQRCFELASVDADVVEGEQVAPWRRPQCSLANDCAQARDV